jgi:cyclopropane fatty-acyl-phospholipid synthase-like methyltransferase
MAFERIQPDTAEWAAFYGNHIQRYMFAAEKLKPLGRCRVLDVACGVGYGSRFIANECRCEVVGVDRDPNALKLATSRFSHPDVSFIADDCHTLEKCGCEEQFDAIVCFETIEHLTEPGRFLRRCAQLLRPSGTLIISTPNQTVIGHSDWEYHVTEYTASQFVALLKESGFNNQALLGQSLTSFGRLRTSVRAELNRVYANPFARMGRFIQRMVRNRKDMGVVLPEQPEDFEIKPIVSSKACEDLGRNGPLVLICIANCEK